jgi:DDE family transposase
MLRPGSAGSNTAADHIALADAAIAALPPAFRRRLMITVDGAGASHDLVKHLDKLAARPGYQVIYSVGWALGEREKAALRLVPEQAWQIAIDSRGEVRERRADDACPDESCAHRACWIEEAHVTGLTGLLRSGPGGDQLKAWPATMRVFARRERPHPGAQLTLFEAGDGWRYSLWATNRPAATRGWLGQAAYIDAAHRVQARVEDAIRTGKDTGLGHFPSFDYQVNAAWLTTAMTAQILLAWLKLLALDGDLAKAEPKTLRPINRTAGCCRSSGGQLSPRPIVGLPERSRSPGRGSHVASLTAAETGHTVLNRLPSFSSLPIFDVSRGGPLAPVQPPWPGATSQPCNSACIVRRSYRVLHAAARLVRGGRKRHLKIQATWPWADAITAAWQRIDALPQAP